MAATLDDVMETASQALAEMDYARCEALCVEALGKARDAQEWVMYQRILLPLQEARRQRRQSALDGPILLGTPNKNDDASQPFDDITQGCVVLTWPYTASDAQAINSKLHQSADPIELLFADNATDAETWRITGMAGPGLSIDLLAPKPEWIGRWVEPSSITPPTPNHWFMQASEALGNAAIAAIDAMLGTLDYLKALEDALACVNDHEILHQRLAAAAKALHEAKR